MIKFVYAFHHDAANYYLKPDIQDLDPERVVPSLKRDLVRNAATYVRNGLQECSFNVLGTFDDEIGAFVSDIRVLIQKDDIIKILRNSLGEVVSDGKAN